MKPFTKNVVSIIQAIPAGYVMTYGQVAAAAGNRQGARQVVRILHSLSASQQLPWHRIINAKGGISTPPGALDKELRQRNLLESEGIVFRENGTVDLEQNRWFPPDAQMDY